MVAKSLEGEIKFDDSEESEVIDDNEDKLNKNRTMTDVHEYSPRPNEYKNSTYCKCIPCLHCNNVTIIIQV